MRISDWSSDVCSSDLLILSPQFLGHPLSGAINGIDIVSGEMKPVTHLLPRQATIHSDFAGNHIINKLKSINGAPIGLMKRCQRSEEHTSELQSLMRISYAVFCLTKKKTIDNKQTKS